MRKSPRSLFESFRHGRRGMSTVAIVFLVLGIIFMIMVVMIVILAALLYPAISSARSAARATMSRNNLKQIGLAMHNYHDVYNQFPPGGIYRENGQPCHGWMTSLLPYAEQSHIYQLIDFNEAWDAPGNQSVFRNEVMPYMHPQVLADSPADSHVGVYGAAHYAGNARVLKDNGRTRIADMIDGTSNTILAGEVNAGFLPWGDPANRRDPAAGLNGGPGQFGSNLASRQGADLLLADGSVRFVDASIDSQTLQNLANPADGNPVHLPEF